MVKKYFTTLPSSLPTVESGMMKLQGKDAADTSSEKTPEEDVMCGDEPAMPKAAAPVPAEEPAEGASSSSSSSSSSTETDANNAHAQQVRPEQESPAEGAGAAQIDRSEL